MHAHAHTHTQRLEWGKRVKMGTILFYSIFLYRSRPVLKKHSVDYAKKCEFCHFYFTFLNHIILPYFEKNQSSFSHCITLCHWSLRFGYEMLNRNINHNAFGNTLPDPNLPSTHDIYWPCRKQWYHIVVIDNKLSENHAKGLNHGNYALLFLHIN